jgi:hypothetical protein
VWDHLWSKLARSLDGSIAPEVASRGLTEFRNGSTSSSALKFDVKSLEPALAPSFRSRLRMAISIVSLSQAAAVLLVAGLSWWFFVAPKQQVASRSPAGLSHIKPAAVFASLSSVEIEEGHLVVILADPKSPSVVDRTPKGMTAGVDRAYVDWYGDERSFDWPQVFNEVESLAKPKVAMQE